MALKLTKAEKRKVCAAARKAAVAMADLWDVLRDIEEAHEIEFDDTARLIGELSGGCEIPPHPDDIADQDILCQLEECLVVTEA